MSAWRPLLLQSQHLPPSMVGDHEAIVRQGGLAMFAKVSEGVGWAAWQLRSASPLQLCHTHHCNATTGRL